MPGKGADVSTSIALGEWLVARRSTENKNHNEDNCSPFLYCIDPFWMCQAANLRSRPADPEQYFRDAFKHYDRNQDNEIEADELSVVIQALYGPQSSQEARRLINLFGEEEKENLTKDQFNAMMTQAFKENITDEELQKSFTLYDADNSDNIDASELVKLLGEHRSEAEYQELIDYVDANSSGNVDFLEFSTVARLHHIIMEQYRLDRQSEL